MYPRAPASRLSSAGRFAANLSELRKTTGAGAQGAAAVVAKIVDKTAFKVGPRGARLRMSLIEYDGQACC
jgi:hypothetical protein